MGKSSRRKGARNEHQLVTALPKARKVSRTGYPGPDILWRNRYIEAKYRKDGFKTLYKWLQDDASILAVRAARKDWLMVIPIDVLLDLLEEAEWRGRKNDV